MGAGGGVGAGGGRAAAAAAAALPTADWGGLPTVRRLSLLCALATPLLKRSGLQHPRSGHALLAMAIEAAPSGCLAASAGGSAGDSDAEQLATASAAASGAVRCLLSHMASASDQLERSRAYATLGRSLFLWPPRERLVLLSDLIGGCPLSNSSSSSRSSRSRSSSSSSSSRRVLNSHLHCHVFFFKYGRAVRVHHC